MKKYLPLCFALIFAGFGCSAPEKSTDSKIPALHLEILDSLDLQMLGDPLITSVSESGDSFLFYDFASGDIILTDKDGKVQSQFNKSEDTPDSYEFMVEAPGFVGEDQLAIVGMAGIFLYDKAGNMIKKINHPESLGGGGFMAFPGKSVETIALNGQTYLVTRSLRSRDTYPGEQKYYDTFKHLELVDIEQESSIEIIPFEQNSRFLDGMGYYESDFWPALEANDDKLYLALAGEPTLYRYSLSPEGATLDTLINLTIPGFAGIEGTSRAEFAEGTVMLNGSTSSIQNIHVLGDKLILNYYGGISTEDNEALSKLYDENKMEEAEELYVKLDSQVSRGMLVFDLDSLTFLGNLSLPENADLESFASGGGYLWMQKNRSVEEEEDFLRIYKVKLIEK
ncbi:hypothetical protein [Algoriphagus antarcticus]|uniref:6-bladed beta-propeller protein n=1 Tax=Algoriphagus antarcticus TaxID=238540 RepID=A0A3E0DWW8_9BACT|nr:hypothetical protein [Algoriphagus antarcticus]REG90562.1 hypothetical protein C8N25_10660 [Algoriphagus antarcticus]